MIWYCDSETVQLTTENISKIQESQYTGYINTRLDQSKRFVNRMYEESRKAKADNLKNKDKYKTAERKLNRYKSGKMKVVLSRKRLLHGHIWMKKLTDMLEPEIEERTILVLNVLNQGINENNVEIMAHRPDIFFKRLASITKAAGEKTATVYYHNLKFDMTNILDYLWTNNCKFTVTNSLIVGTKWYSYQISYYGIRITFLDSYNLTMSKLKKFGKAFGLPKELWKSEYEFDFKSVENINRMLQGDRELEKYGMQDVRCLKAGVEAFKKFANADKMTLASTAFAVWQNTAHSPLADLTLKEQLDANLTYTGAICYCNPEYQGKVLNGQYVYIDNNGLYSAAGYSECAGFKHPYPVGMGRYCTNGKPDIWNIYKYYTIRVTIFAVAKTDTTIPFFRLGKQSALGQPFQRKDEQGRLKPYKQNEYLDVVNETCYINSIDLRLLYKYYHVQRIEYDYWWEYDTEIGIFDEYSDHWIKEKEIGTRTHNAPRKTVAKFMNNALTGKFGQFIEPIVTAMEFNDTDNILIHAHKKLNKTPKFIYMPIVSAILAYAREIFLDMTNSYPKEHFIYCDTDSNIMTREAFWKYIDKTKMSKFKLGYWDIENDIIKLKVLRQKTYMFTTKRGEKIEREDGTHYFTEHKTECRCAGATEEIKKKLTYENFELGRQIAGAYQLKPRIVPGGTALISQPYVLRQSFMGKL